MIHQVEVGLPSGNLIVELDDPVEDQDEAFTAALEIIEAELGMAKLRQVWE